jgi:hypothetical protein
MKLQSVRKLKFTLCARALNFANVSGHFLSVDDSPPIVVWLVSRQLQCTTSTYRQLTINVKSKNLRLIARSETSTRSKLTVDWSNAVVHWRIGSAGRTPFAQRDHDKRSGGGMHGRQFAAIIHGTHSDCWRGSYEVNGRNPRPKSVVTRTPVRQVRYISSFKCHADSDGRTSRPPLVTGSR